VLQTDPPFSDAVEAAVGRIEANTQAELVVVVAGRSGNYRDLSLLAGICTAALGLVLALFAPVDFHAAWIPVDLLMLFACVAWASRRLPWVMRHLASSDRKSDQVDHAANAAFHKEAVHATRDRCGVLIYLSLLEDQIRIIPDVGVSGRVPPAELDGLSWSFQDSEALIAGLDALGAVLAEHLPSKGASENLISNAPRIHP